MSKRTRKPTHSASARRNDWILLGGGAVVIAALITLVVFRSNRSAAVGAPALAAVPAAAASPADDHDHGKESSVSRITAADLRGAFDRGEAAVIDVRDIDSFAAGHIAGAMHIPLEFIESQVPHLPRNKMLVTYCT